MKMDRIADTLKDEPRALAMRDLLNDKEAALNLAGLAEQEMGALAPGAVPTPDQEALASLMGKLNTLAQQSPESKERPVEFTLQEQMRLMPMMGRYKRGLDAVKTAEKFVSGEDMETIVRVMALHPAQAEMAGILGIDESKAGERVQRALNHYAYRNPEEYAGIINNLSTARNFFKSDWSILNPIFKRMEQFGVDKAAVLEALDHDDWEARLGGAVEARMQGASPGLLNRYRAWRTGDLLHHWGSYIETYRSHAAERSRFTGEIDNAFRKVFMEQGVVGQLLVQEALQPDAPPESKRAYEAMEVAKKQVGEVVRSPAKLDAALRARYESHPMWRYRQNPAVADSFARDWLETESRSALNVASEGASVGGFWTALWDRFMSSLFGSAYGHSEVSSVTDRLRSM